MPRADVGGHELAYEVHGDAGDWVVLIMGIGYARWAWEHQIDAFAARHRVLTFDQRGIGDSDTVLDYTVADLGRDLVALMDAVGIERAHLVASSAGGFVGLQVAADAPDRVDRLVLASTADHGAFDIYGKPTLALFEAAPTLEPEERLTRFTLNAFSAEYGTAHPEVISSIVERRTAQAQSIEAYTAHANANLAFDIRDRLAEVTAPTLVLHGMDDRVVRPVQGRELAEALPNASLEVLPVGHLVFIEEASLFNATVLRFLEAA